MVVIVFAITGVIVVIVVTVIVIVIVIVIVPHAGEGAPEGRRVPDGRVVEVEPEDLGWLYLSNATCLMRPHLCYACFVVSRSTIICYIIRHF